MIQSSIEPYGWLLGAFCFIPIVWFIISILLCIWVYKDAESRGMNAVMWLIVVLIGGIIGVIIYLVVRKEKGAPPSAPQPVTRVCANCGRVIPPDVKFCPQCGKPVPE